MNKVYCIQSHQEFGELIASSKNIIYYKDEDNKLQQVNKEKVYIVEERA